MSIANSNLTYFGNGPVAGGSNVVLFKPGAQGAYIGTVTITGDGSATSAVVNFIDGSNVLPFTPTSVSVVRTGGNAANSIVMYASSSNTTAAVVTFSAAPGNLATVTLAVTVYQ